MKTAAVNLFFFSVPSFRNYTLEPAVDQEYTIKKLKFCRGTKATDNYSMQVLCLGKNLYPVENPANSALQYYLKPMRPSLRNGIRKKNYSPQQCH